MKTTSFFGYVSLILAYSNAALAADPIPFAKYARFIPTGPGSLYALFTSLVTCLAVGSLARQSLGQSEIYVVSPSELEHVEGNRGVAGGRAGPGGAKYQGLYFAEDYMSLPDTHRIMTGLAWRPDGNNSYTNPVTGSARFVLSTTDADGLSSTFADNLGDDTTVVFDGTLTWQDASVGSVPRDFDFYVPFDVPFAFDPTDGNLVLEFVAPTDWDNVGNWHVDGREFFTGNVTAVAGGVSSSVASIAHRTIFVAQFEFVPEPSSALLVRLGAITVLRYVPRPTRRVPTARKVSTYSASSDTGA